jgi:hypothetical protein
MIERDDYFTVGRGDSAKSLSPTEESKSKRCSKGLIRALMKAWRMNELF